jgi:hypothetical protein
MQASVAPEPVMYHGSFVAEGWFEASLSLAVEDCALLWKAERVNVTGTAVAELIVTVSVAVEAGEKA